MSRNKKLLLVVSSLTVLVMVAGACEINLPMADCSWIDQPDMGGLVCLGTNVLGLSAGIIAILVALFLGVGSAIGG